MYGDSCTITCYVCGSPSSKEWARKAETRFNNPITPYFPFLLKIIPSDPNSVLDENGSALLCAFCHAALESQWNIYESQHIVPPSKREYKIDWFVCGVCAVETYRKRVRALPIQDFPFLKLERQAGSIILVNEYLGLSVAAVCLDCSETLWSQSAEFDRWGLPLEKRHFNWLTRPPPPENSVEAHVARLPSGEKQIPRPPLTATAKERPIERTLDTLAPTTAGFCSCQRCMSLQNCCVIPTGAESTPPFYNPYNSFDFGANHFGRRISQEGNLTGNRGWYYGSSDITGSATSSAFHIWPSTAYKFDNGSKISLDETQQNAIPAINIEKDSRESVIKFQSTEKSQAGEDSFSTKLKLATSRQNTDLRYGVKPFKKRPIMQSSSRSVASLDSSIKLNVSVDMSLRCPTRGRGTDVPRFKAKYPNYGRVNNFGRKYWNPMRTRIVPPHIVAKPREIGEISRTPATTRINNLIQFSNIYWKYLKNTIKDVMIRNENPVEQDNNSEFMNKLGTFIKSEISQLEQMETRLVFNGNPAIDNVSWSKESASKSITTL